MEWNGMEWRSLIFIRKNTSFHTTFSLYFFFFFNSACQQARECEKTGSQKI